MVAGARGGSVWSKGRGSASFGSGGCGVSGELRRASGRCGRGRAMWRRQRGVLVLLDRLGEQQAAQIEIKAEVARV